MGGETPKRFANGRPWNTYLKTTANKVSDEDMGLVNHKWAYSAYVDLTH